MKIKRKEYEQLEAKLAYYKKLCTTRFVVGVEAGKLLDMDLESMAISARYSGPENTEWITGPVSFRVIAPDYASGYEHFLVSRYLAATPNPPWNVFQRIKLSPVVEFGTEPETGEKAEGLANLEAYRQEENTLDFLTPDSLQNMPPSKELIIKRLIQYRLAMLTRDGWIIEARKAGMSKYQIHQITGLARTTIDRILEPLDTPPASV